MDWLTTAAGDRPSMRREGTHSPAGTGYPQSSRRQMKRAEHVFLRERNPTRLTTRCDPSGAGGTRTPRHESSNKKSRAGPNGTKLRFGGGNGRAALGNAHRAAPSSAEPIARKPALSARPGCSKESSVSRFSVAGNRRSAAPMRPAVSATTTMPTALCDVEAAGREVALQNGSVLLGPIEQHEVRGSPLAGRP